MGKRLDNKCVLVTGGGSGIGKAICQLFSREGANIAIIDSNENAAKEVMQSLEKGRHCVVAADVTKADDVKRAFKMAEENFGRKCDVVVNNAGITGSDYAFVSDIDEGVYDSIMNVNLKGKFLVAKEFLNSVKTVDKDVRGVLINTSSAYARVAPSGCGEYSASKVGVVAFTKTIANEFRVHRVRCNAIMPSRTRTPMVLDTVREEELKIWCQNHPMKRLAEPIEMAYGFLFLASEESSYVNGACLEINGGMYI